jgi:hypothetical protein
MLHVGRGSRSILFGLSRGTRLRLRTPGTHQQVCHPEWERALPLVSESRPAIIFILCDAS